MSTDWLKKAVFSPTHNLLSAIHSDSVVGAAVRGDIIIANSTPLWTKLAIGTVGKYLRTDGSDPSWQQIALTDIAAATSANLAGIISDETGTGALVFANTPTLVTPALGVATATSINKVTITAPATSATLTIADGKVLTASNTLTFTGTDGSSAAFGTGGTVAYTANKLSAFAATTSAELAGVISDETGSGLLVFGTAPTFASTINIGTAGGTTGTIYLNGTTSGTVTIKPADTAGTYTLTLPTDDGGVSQFLQTNGSGVLTWATPSGTTIDAYEDGASVVTGITRLDFKDFNIEDAGGNIAHIYHNISNICNGRLTLTSGTPVTTSDVTAAGTLYFTPYNGDEVSLFDGTRWKVYTFTERSLALTITSGKNYDVFLYNNAGTLTLELSAAWTNDTTRADALTTQNGIYVKSGATTRRRVGMIRASGANITEDSAAKRYVKNAKQNNTQVDKRLFISPAYVDDNAGNTFTLTNTNFAQINAGTNDSVSYLSDGDDLVDVIYHAYTTSVTASGIPIIGIGVDSTTGAYAIHLVNTTAAQNNAMFVSYRNTLPAGFHTFYMLGRSTAGTITFQADGGRAGGTFDPYATHIQGRCSV